MLEDVHLSLLTKQLETHPKLKILNLGHNKISNEGYLYLPYFTLFLIFKLFSYPFLVRDVYLDSSKKTK